jgi:pantoate--beta-alanine ligase
VRVVATIPEVRQFRRTRGGSLGLVPTMGYLHRGHRSLVERARAENDAVAASLFVNPLQFGPQEDLANYPRDFERDRSTLEEAGCDLLFAPTPAELYPPGFQAVVELPKVAARLEGERRPGHFRGVATVVLKLLNIVGPTRAYFGEKDAQQLQVIRTLVRDLDVPTQVVGCPIVREPDGLALSSRNVYLNEKERGAAPVLHRALRAAEALYRGGERSAEALRAAMRATLEAEPLAQTDYVAVTDPETFDELESIGGPAQLVLAARLGKARLIDALRLP